MKVKTGKVQGVMEKKRSHMRREFLALTPLQRMNRMSTVFNDFVALKAKMRGSKEIEVYREYLRPSRQGR